MRLDLRGLVAAPSQLRGSVRLVPLLRSEVRADLRLWRRPQRAAVTAITLGGEPGSAGLHYWSYIPSSLVLDWTEDGAPVAAADSQLLGPKDRPRFFKLEHRMAKRTAERSLRFFPQDLAIEGLLTHHFRGPDIVSKTWSQGAIRRGLDPRSESFTTGWSIQGLEEALRTFELHPQQVGVLVFVAEVFGAAFVMPSPEDYRPLHSTLLLDAFGEILANFALWHPTVHPWAIPAERPPRDLADLRAQLAEIRRSWASFHTFMAEDLLAEELRWSPVYRAGPFTLARFLPTFTRGRRAHIGEAILDDDGQVQYLRTVLLSEAARERAWWLDQLAAVEWDLPRLAEKLASTEDQLKRRLMRAGWGELLREKPQGEGRRPSR